MPLGSFCASWFAQGWRPQVRMTVETLCSISLTPQMCAKNQSVSVGMVRNSNNARRWGGPDITTDHGHDGGFPSAIGTQQRKDLGALNCEGHDIDSDVATRALCYVFDTQICVQGADADGFGFLVVVLLSPILAVEECRKGEIRIPPDEQGKEE
ncbi:hypothetical protein GQ43DRAFT_460414 [Delitschia confertaspora ATCC 74209]|uniref:Uncharacterized protein n=1 Tax=Delitschia confertaspora ATCC 74209 TaxID=1513339 RepID=A0A9P4JWN9_9PLEO|nr:hypothetical protein GQ43DRAFT_460414 [Delitschia confertaspora ATCC 74209]